MDNSRVSAVWVNRANDTTSGYAHCLCGFEDHADLAASETFLEWQTDQAVRSTARSVRFEWGDHDRSESPRSHESPKQQRTDPNTVYRDGNVASGSGESETH